MITISGESVEELAAILSKLRPPKEQCKGTQNISADEKLIIIDLDKKGKSCEEIKELLGIKNGRQISGIIKASKSPVQACIAKKVAASSAEPFLSEMKQDWSNVAITQNGTKRYIQQVKIPENDRGSRPLNALAAKAWDREQKALAGTKS